MAANFTRATLLVALSGAAMWAAAAPAQAAPRWEDANCFVEPQSSQCIGTAAGSPTSPVDPSCAMDPADAVCAGGPYSGGQMPGSGVGTIGTGLPGSINVDGLPYGAPPMPTMSAPGTIPGMPGSI